MIKTKLDENFSMQMNKDKFQSSVYGLILVLIISSCEITAQTIHSFWQIPAGNIFRENKAITFSKLGNNAFIQNRIQTLELNAFRNTADVTGTGTANMGLFDNFGNNILDSFKGNNIYLHLAGIASTILISSQNIDYDVEHFFNQHEEYSNIARPVVISGQLLPFIVGGSLYLYGKVHPDKEILGASFAVMQASIITLLYNSTLKAITGRPHPDWQHVKDMESLSKTFRFGFLRGGVFWGWPSGHTAATTAVVSALMGYYPNSTWLKIAGFSLMAYTIFGVSAFHRGGMHWFSDAIAAAFMNYAVGSTVGRFYRKEFSGSSGQSAVSSRRFSVSPLGINFSFQF